MTRRLGAGLIIALSCFFARWSTEYGVQQKSIASPHVAQQVDGTTATLNQSQL